MIRWEFLDEDEMNFVGIEQLSETEFAAAAGSSWKTISSTTFCREVSSEVVSSRLTEAA